ncbi:hypothetical protein OK348_11525 [Flavobacterium sp. MXW15]|uniref:VOC family protein n=1 Tax=Xanthomonas chitinilytica TaxID=2989819 RepID=A0ABT3JYG1_9XANT|nr:VOC family protein [Xanthomonas sp. H13-6]MCW4455419.1 hypothetical protein [Flavobacterium sp. MXW15]MCW4473499.1 VOC family protein [Xanthomonas sp. H13-6]
MEILVNLDVPDLAAAERCYAAAFGLRPGRRIGQAGVEMLGAAVPLWLLEKAEASRAAGDDVRRYRRHWTPVHIDVVVERLEPALARAEAAGLVREGTIREGDWGRIVGLADPFGHGWCLIQFLGRGYDEIADAAG